MINFGLAEKPLHKSKWIELARRRNRLKRTFQCFYFIMILLPSFFAFAGPSFTNNFNVKQDAAELEKIQSHIDQLEYSELQDNKKMVTSIEERAKVCIKKTKRDLLKLEELSSSNNPNTNNSIKEPNKIENFLDAEKSKTKAIFSDCKLLLYESQKLKKQLSAKFEQEITGYTFSKTSPLWKVEDTRSLLKLPQYDFNQLYQLSGIQHIQNKQSFFELIIVIFSGLLLTHLVYRFLRRLLPKNKLSTQLLKLFHRYFLPTTTFVFIHFFLESDLQQDESSIINQFSKVLFFYLFMLFFIQMNCVLFAYRKKRPVQQITRKLSIILRALISSLFFCDIYSHLKSS